MEPELTGKSLHRVISVELHKMIRWTGTYAAAMYTKVHSDKHRCDKKCLYSFEYQPTSTNCHTPSIRRLNDKNIAWCIAQKNAVQSLIPTCAFWLSAHMVANYMAWSLKIPDKLVDAYIHLALNLSARQGCSILVELHKKFGWFIFSTASFLVCNVEFWRATGPR